MKKISLIIVFLMIFAGNAYAVFNSGSTGADGAFNPSSNTQLQLPPAGVFNFTTVNIPSGVTVTFIKNAENTPVYILASGDVVINGIIDVSGKPSNSPSPGIGGPGGYDGGFGGVTNSPGGTGLGPGGGGGAPSDYWWRGGGGGFGTSGGFCEGGHGSGGPVYGNERLQPIIGGSGGGGNSHAGSYGGCGGGGAIIIASSGSIVVNGSILADGGGVWTDFAGSGSGGAIKIIANVISGDGTITAKGGHPGSCSQGGKGRIRLEAYANNLISGTDPPYTYGLPESVFPANEPILRITSIAGVNAPANPTGSYAQPDIMLPSETTNPVTVNLSASYIPVGTTVTVSVIPQYGSTSNVDTTLSGVLASTTASASVNISTQYSNVIMAQATYVMQEAMFWDGEKIDKVRVAATIGREPETVYITDSGKEIKSNVLKLAGLVK